MQTGTDATSPEFDAPPSRLAVRLILSGVALMALAGTLMWWHFGPSMFMNLLTAAANCF